MEVYGREGWLLGDVQGFFPVTATWHVPHADLDGGPKASVCTELLWFSEKFPGLCASRGMLLLVPCHQVGGLGQPIWVTLPLSVAQRCPL